MSQKSDAWLKLTQTIAKIETKLSTVLQQQHKMGLSEYRALNVLSQAPNSEMRMQELAAYLQLNQSSVSRLVERLERDDYTIRDLCPKDKRGVYTVLTQRGRDCLKEAQVDYEAALEKALREYDCDSLLSMAFIENP